MPVKIRLARRGRKARPFYHIVVADSRAPRDGKYIEKLGLYNPNTNPATIDLDFDKALDWLQKGAQPTDTARSILSREGVMIKKHLLGGVTKGAFSEDEAESRFNKWMKEREQKVMAENDKITKAIEAEEKERLARESKINEERAAEIAKRKADAEAELVAAVKGEEAEEEESDETAEEVTEVAAEAEVTEAPVEEAEPAKEETTAEEAPAKEVEETKAEAPAEEAPAKEAEETKAEAPAEETEAPAAEAEKTEDAPADDADATEEETKK